MKTVHAIRHVSFEDLGTLGVVLRDLGFCIRYFEAPKDDLAKVDACAPELMIVLGGPIGANDDALYPFITHELKLIQQRLNAGLPLLGICLGAQLIARCAGASVVPMGRKEIGFHKLTLTEEGLRSSLSELDDVPVFHWHGDEFQVPFGAVPLAETEICRNQAFALGPNVLGLQFHAEVDARQIEPWLVGHSVELVQGAFDQRSLRAEAHRHAARLSASAYRFFDRWIKSLSFSSKR